ncbi:hypothetical protein [Deinococcus reticulitermitis]|nr:hypothetical protein [Deinococcus reticulitermitis]
MYYADLDPLTKARVEKEHEFHPHRRHRSWLRGWRRATRRLTHR